MERYLLDAIDPLPHLLWDTAFPVEELMTNKPFRNIGDLLVKRCPTNRNALRLCGCDATVTDGIASDYECFSALCIAFPMLTGHRAATLTKVLLSRIFGLETPLSPFQSEELWSVLNQAIDEAELRPSHVAQALNVESICYRHPALSPLPETDFPNVDCYPIFDLNDPIGTLSHSVFGDKGLSDSITILSKRLDAFRQAGCVAARLILPRDYAFSRNSKKKEIDELLIKSRRGEFLTEEGRRQLMTAFLIAWSNVQKEASLTLLLETAVPEDELLLLYDYWALNGAVPETVFLFRHAENYAELLNRHTVRTEKGLPSLLPVSEDLARYAPHFPIGTALLPCNHVCDVLSLTEGALSRQHLAAVLAPLAAAPDTLASLAEDVAYGNIKNRFGI